MKNKPLRHKESNTFKFLPFAERISNIDVDVFHRVGHRNEEDDSDQSETYFYQALQKWNVMNLSESYEAFRKELPSTQTLPLLLNQKEEVVSVLLKYLKLQNPLSLQPILEMVVALARDLRLEIYPFYPELLQCLIKLLSTKDAEQLEWTLTCLAYMFKFLWRYLVKDITTVFDNLLPLFTDAKPSYINNFAAESFAFVARKVKDKKAFLSLVLQTLQKRPDSLVGCGRLLFEVIRGVTGQFHSCVEVFLPLYFSSLADHSMPQQLLFEVLTHMVTAMCTSIRPQKSNLFWTIAMDTVEKHLPSWETDTECLCHMLKLVQQAVDYRNAVLLSEPVPLVQRLVPLLIQSGLPEAILLVASDIGASLLMSGTMRLPQENASQLTLKILSVPYPGTLLSFVCKVLGYSGFEALILPRLMDYCRCSLERSTVDNGVPIDKSVLQILTRLILHKAPPCESGLDLKRWQRYPLELHKGAVRKITRQSSKVNLFTPLLEGVLSVSSAEEMLENVEDLLCVIICLPHIEPLDSVATVQHLSKMLNLLSTALGVPRPSSESEDNISTEESRIQNLLILFSVVLETLLHLTDTQTLRKVCEFQTVIETLAPYASEAKYFSALRALDMYLTAYNLKDSDVKLRLNEVLEQLYDKLAKNNSSPFHKVRLVTMHIFSLFEHALELPSTPDGSDHWKLFSNAMVAESVVPTINEYRDKLQHLQKLEYEVVQYSVTKYPKYEKMALSFLLGQLYVNFQLLWEPVIQMVTSHARGLPLSIFWEVFGEQLLLAARQVTAGGIPGPAPCAIGCDFLRDVYTMIHELEDKPDYVNYRILLWKAFAEFPEVCEMKNREVSPIFLTFLEDEYLRSDADVANTWNIKQGHRHEEDMEVDTPEQDLELKTIKSELTKQPPPSKQKKLTSRSSSKTLLAHMGVFVKLRNPKSIYREQELNKIYYDFLMHKNPEIQKMALNCLLTYKHKYLLPYKEHLYGLMDDATFKTELINFRIDKESEVIEGDHRRDLMPVVMRIVYSKMLTKTGGRTSGKALGELRRSLVLRFLAGCHEDEMMIFMEMAFRIVNKFIQDDPVVMVQTIIESIDLEHVIPLKRLQSSVNLLGVVMAKFGNLMGHRVLPFLLRVLLSVGAVVTGVSAQRESIHAGYFPALRALRSTCLETMARFFEHFNDFLWSSSDVNAVFQVFVWPGLEKLPLEGVYSPTALLKLFVAWSQHPRYFLLLAKHAEGNLSLTPLPYIMQLFVGQKTHPSVTNTIMELLERLLTMSDHKPEECEGAEEDDDDEKNTAPPLEVDSILPIDNKAIERCSLSESLNYGSCLLLPHVGAILKRLQMKLSALKGRGLGRRDLVVLARISELVWDEATSDVLLRLLLPTLVKKAGASEQTVTHLVTTLANLIKNVPDPEKYIRSLAPLFGAVAATPPRKLLCDLLITIAERNSSDQREGLLASARLVGEINAWDARWVEQPDFNRRLDGFKRVHELLSAGQIELDLGVIIIHNCFYLLKSEKDLSLRESAGYCLRKVTPALCLKYRHSAPEREFLVNDTVLQLVRAGIRDKSDAVQHEAISLLGELARECESVHPVLQDLGRLANKADPEVDFFENLLHLQSHRKSRALLRFCDIAKELVKAPNPRTLTQFILPLASSFLCSEKFASKNSIVDAAIQTIGTVCRLLPWHQYETILRFYLTKLRHNVEYQKQVVRIVVVILDAFHYDLSRAKVPVIVPQGESLVEEKTEERTEASLVGEVNGIEVSALLNVVMEVNDSAGVEQTEDGDTLGKELRETGDTLDEELEETGDMLEDELEETGDSALLKPVGDILVEKLEKELDNCLEKDLVVEDGEEALPCSEKAVEEPVTLAVNRQVTLPHSTAARVTRTIAVGLLPQIHRSIAQRKQTESLHKVNRKHTGPDQDEDDMLRVPIALAAVKLLQRLPSQVMDQHLPGILMKLCTFLKSRLDGVRKVTRETLQKIMVALGPAYLSLLLRELSALLTKGFHVHVLIYSIHSVLVSLKQFFKPGDIDTCLKQILEVCKMDVFGAASEEKDVAKIAGKLFEARSTKSYDTFHIVAQYITEKCFTDLLLPIKQTLASTHSFKVVHKVSECLRQIVQGLSENVFVSAESLLIFIFGMASESIPELAFKGKKKEMTETERELEARKQPDSFLIPKAPRSRAGAITVTARTSARTNAHMLVEFGLRLYATLLKREKLRSRDYLPFLDPFVPIIAQCLKAPHVKLTTLALQCLVWVLKMDLPSLKDNISDLTASVFSLLHKYAAAGLSKGDNFDLVVAAFKVVTVLVRDVKYHTISTEQLKALLLYAEQDMHDYSRQATAFTLLKAVLARKLVVPEVYDVMHKVSMLSITSEMPHIRLQSRQVFHQFLMDYPLKGKLEQHLTFYISQLSYEVQPGRESALEMVHTIISTFPLGRLTKHSGILFFTLGARLVNDSAPNCRKMVAECLKTLLTRLEKKDCDCLFDIVLLWFKDNKVNHRRLAAQLCGIFVLVEKANFQRHLSNLLPSLLQQFNYGIVNDNEPGRFVRLNNMENGTGQEQNEQLRDHLLFQVLQLLLKIVEHCPALLTSSQFHYHVQTIAENAESLLAHPHEWVRLAAAQLLGHVFSSLDIHQITEAAAGVPRDGYLTTNPRRKLKSLVLDLCAQLQPLEPVGTQLVEQVVKNLVFLGRVLKTLPEGEDALDCEEEESSKVKVSLIWMIRRMRRVAHAEVVQAPKSDIMRTAVFKWIGAMAMDLGREGLPPLLHHLLAPLVREMTNSEESCANLCRLSKEVAKIIKQKVGVEVYTRHLSRLNTQLSVRRADRRKVRAQEVSVQTYFLLDVYNLCVCTAQQVYQILHDTVRLII